MRRGFLLLCLTGALAGVPAQPAAALETDQYYTWGQEMADSTDLVNAKFNLELERSIASFDTPPEECIDVAIRFRKRMRFLLFHQLQMWVLNTSLVEKIPEAGPEDLEYRRTNLYQNHGFFDPGMWMPIVPTIEVNGVRIGTDKLSHFISSGWTYYKSYQRAFKNGKSPLEAERAAVRRGVIEEKLILGAAAIGILSLGDLEANLQGMHFYLDLCSGADPMLVRDGDEWSLGRPVDLREYVHPGWDESYRNSIFRKGRWRKVQPALRQYCDRRGDPKVLEMHRRYRKLDRNTAAQEVLAELLAEGSLQDPELFSLDANCPDPVSAQDTLEDLTVGSAEPGARPKQDPTALIIAHEENSARRMVGLAALRLSYPQVVSVSLGFVASRQPADYDCRTPCDLWGPFAQVEPGVGGGKLSLGYGRIIGEHHRGGKILSNVYLALGIKGTVLRTWGSESLEPTDQTYAGAEFEFSVAKVNFGIGALNRVTGDAGRPWIVTAHLGLGF
jgi:hypothetical protein